MARLETSTGGREATRSVIPGRYALSVGLPKLPQPPGFVWTKLTDVARLESGHTPSRGEAAYWDGDIPWVGIRDATGNHGLTINDTEQHITASGLANSSARLLPAGTVCLSRTASVGFVVTMGVDMATSQDFVNWVCGPGLSSRYLRYILVGEQESVRRFAHGTTHQTMYYPEAKALHVLIPDRREQDAIAEVLGALDDKIAANTKLIDLLIQHQSGEYEAALQCGQQSRRVDYVAEFHNRKRIPLSARERAGRPGLIPYYGATGVFDTVDEPLFDDRLVLVGEDGSVITDEELPVIQYIWGPSWINNHAHVLTGRLVSTELLRFALARTNVAALVTGAVQPKISMGKLKDLTLDLPLSENLPQLEKAFASEMALLRASSEESRTLSIMRDALLPQLMSGRIRVRDAEQMVGDVV